MASTSNPPRRSDPVKPRRKDGARLGQAGSDAQTYAIIGAAQAVHATLGNGFLEAVYQEALGIAFAQHDIPFVRHPRLAIEYGGVLLSRTYCVDYICFDEVIVDLKALARLPEREVAQVLHYLKASGRKVGLLLNFGARSLQVRRLVRS